MSARPRLGDRLEQAIDLHADVEREIAVGEADERTRGSSLRRTIIWLAITGISLYLVAPSVLETLSSWRDIKEFGAIWLLVMLLGQTATLASMWALQRIAIGTGTWPAIISSQLAGNAASKVAPGGGAMGAALQYRLLATAGVPREPAVSGLTAANLLTFAVVLALPVLAIPTLIRGSVDRTLLEAAVVGLIVFAILAALAAVVLAKDKPLLWIGGNAQRARHRP